jgi:hypothetical protein
MDQSVLNHLFNASTIGLAINRSANQFGLLESMGLAPISGIPTTTVAIRYRDGKIAVLPAKERGAPRTERQRSSEKAVYIEVPHFPFGDKLTARDIQDKYRFVDGPNLQLESLAEAQAEHMAEIRTAHDLTLEFMRIGMIKGVIRDGDGSELINLYDTFGIAQDTINFELNDPTTDVKQKCRDLRRLLRKNARGEVINGTPDVIVSTDFFDALISHDNVEKFYLNYQEAAEFRNNPETTGPDYGELFEFGNVRFRSYDADIPLTNGTTEAAIEEGTGYTVPTTAGRLFHTYAAPPDRLDTVNQAPSADNYIHVATEVDPKGKFVDLDTESNMLALNTRPDLTPRVVKE